MAKLLKWGALAVLAIALLIKLSLWLSVRSIMDDAIARLSPLMDVTYTGVTSSFEGRVGLEQLTIRVPMMGDTLVVNHAELKFNGLGELLRFKESLGRGELPKQLALSLKGLTLQVHGPFMQQFYSQPAQRSLLTAMSDVACGDVRTIGTVQLLEMGYRTLESDVELAYRFLPGTKQLLLDLRTDTRDMGEMRVALELANTSDKPGDMAANPPRLAHVTFELNDNQYQRKVQAYCAGKLGQSPQVYLQTAIQHFDQVVRSQQVALDDSLLQAYARYLEDPQSLRLELTPSETMPWGGLNFYDPQDVVRMLNPSVAVNGKAVEPIAFAWAGAPAGKQYGATERITAGPQAEEVRVSPRYEFVKADDLPQYAGKRLQFLTYDGVYYQGILRKIQNGKVYISVQVGTGTAEMNLRLNKINKVRVML
ncbi:hypothetical protein [Pseudomonas mangiferae]|uniref:Uncharacterized protein n=1 Tax=Pseudomonas mangiferae TaxID=2593654 RepID=A0A553GZK8_9PSED|nr:hypothetical protein [Pseudomonas mangiferae]TRX74942.1 hypothetical protein FM069_10465 [Pseudomonas mangiferae]